jgi:hypothetical protein
MKKECIQYDREAVTSCKLGKISCDECVFFIDKKTIQIKK